MVTDNVSRKSILDMLKLEGPMLPIDLVRKLGGNTILIGALLSELASNKAVKISALKVGGSPLYYLPGQEEKLLNFIKYLNEKDRKTVELLQEKKVLRNDEQVPLIQVSLTIIKDFAIPLLVRINGVKETFWKWFLISDEEATNLIRDMLSFTEESNSDNSDNSDNNDNNNNNVKNIDDENNVINKNNKLNDSLNENSDAEVLDKINNIRLSNTYSDDVNNEENNNINKNDKNNKGNKNNVLSNNVSNIVNNSNNINKIKNSIVNSDLNNYYDSEDGVDEFLLNNNFQIISKNVARKNKEFDYELFFISKLFKIKMFCKYFKKSKISDSDLSKFYVNTLVYKLPVLFLYDGTLTKKAELLLNKFENFFVVKLE